MIKWYKNPFIGAMVLFAIVLVLFIINVYKSSKTTEPILLDVSEIEMIEQTLNKPEEKIETPVAYNETEEDIVSFNPNSLKYHQINCEWAKKCKRCIKIKKQDAVQKGGIPCKVCGD